MVSEQRTPAKILRVIKSKEYSRSMLKKAFLDCKETTALLAQIYGIQEKRTEAIARLEAEQFIDLALDFNGSLETYSSTLELNKDPNAAIGDLYVYVIRQGALKAASKALQDIH